MHKAIAFTSICIMAVACVTARPQTLYADPAIHNLIGSPALNVPPPVDVTALRHPAVVENSQWEATLPQHLINPIYKNPHVAAALAKESWFGYKEFPVHNREAEHIPRERIAKMLRGAGLVRRR